MPDGFYSVTFNVPSPQGSRTGGGVVVLTKGRIYGGDSSYSYEGSYLVEGKRVQGSVYGSPFNEYLQSVFLGLDADTKATFEGYFNDVGFVIQGHFHGVDQAVGIRGTLITKFT